MGAESKRNDDKSIGKIESGAGTRTGAGTTSSSSTAPGYQGTGAGTGAGTRTAAGTQTGETIVPQLVLVDDTAKTDEQKREERNAKRRERYAKQKAENGESVKPKRVRRKKDSESETINKESFNVMIAGISSVIASRPDCEHWLLSEKEIDTITTPLCKMLAESETFKNIGEYSNQIALVMACITIITPRLMVTLAKQKEKKEHAVTGNSVNTIPRTDGKVKKETNRKPNKNDRSNQGHVTTTSTNNADNVLWYGEPLA